MYSDLCQRVQVWSIRRLSSMRSSHHFHKVREEVTGRVAATLARTDPEPGRTTGVSRTAASTASVERRNPGTDCFTTGALLGLSTLLVRHSSLFLSTLPRTIRRAWPALNKPELSGDPVTDPLPPLPPLPVLVDACADGLRRRASRNRI